MGILVDLQRLSGNVVHKVMRRMIKGGVIFALSPGISVQIQMTFANFVSGCRNGRQTHYYWPI